MSRRGPRSAVALSALLLATLLGLVVVAGAAVGAGVVAAPAAATVRLDGVSPSLPGPADTLTLTGSVTNTSESDLGLLNAYLRLSSIPLRTPADLAQLSDPDFRPGFRTQFFSPVTDTLAPGASAAFHLDVAMADLELAEQGVYVAGVEIRATVADGSRTAVGAVMTVLPYIPDAAALPQVGVAWVWPLTAPVARGPDGVFLDDALGAAMETDGPLGAAFAAAGAAPITWLVDPAVAQAAADMASGYAVHTTSGTAPGAHAEAAGQWLADIRAAAAAGRVSLLPYGDVDAVALTRAGLGADVASALAVRGSLGDDLLPGATDDLGYGPDGLLDTPTLEALGTAGVQQVLIASAGLDTPSDPAAPRATLRAGGRTFEAIRVDTPAQPEGSTPIQQRQLLIARTALAAITAPSASVGSDPSAGTIVLTPPAGALSGSVVASLLEIAQTAPWVRDAALADATDTPAVAGTLVYPDSARAAELPGSYLSQVASLRSRGRVLAALTDSASDDASAAPSSPDPSAAGGATTPSAPSAAAPAASSALAFERAVLRTESAAWRGDVAGAQQVLAAQLAAVDGRLASVHIASTGTITLSSSRGRFPLTVENELDQAITVRIDLRPQATTRLRMSDVPAVSIGAGQLATVDVEAEAGANGTFLVDVQLVAPNGAVLGAPTVLTLRATEYDTVAWIVIIVAGGLLFTAVGVRLVRRIARARRRATADADEAESDPSASDPSASDPSASDSTALERTTR